MRWLIVLLLTVGLVACGGDGGDGGDAANGAGDGTSTSTPGGAGSDDDAAAARQVCAFLEQELEKFQDEGSSGVGALATFATDLVTFVAEHPGQQLSGSRLDALANDGCPEVRSELLELLGVQDFGAV